MIIFDDGSWQTDTANPDGNFLEGNDCRQPKWVISDSSELARKIKSTHYWKAVEDEAGQLVDIVIEELPVSYEQQIAELKNQLDEIDRQAIRPLRAIAAGTDTEEDRETLAELERQAEAIRSQIAELEGDE